MKGMSLQELEGPFSQHYGFISGSATFEKLIIGTAEKMQIQKSEQEETLWELIRKHWTDPMRDTIFDMLNKDLELEDIMMWNKYQDLCSTWLITFTTKSLGLKLTDQNWQLHYLSIWEKKFPR